MTHSHALFAVAVFGAALLWLAAQPLSAAEVIVTPDGDTYYGSSGLAPTNGYFDPNGPMPTFLNRPLRPVERSQFFRGRLRVPAITPWTFGPGIWTPTMDLPIEDQWRTGVSSSLGEYWETAPRETGSYMRASGFGIGPSRFATHRLSPRGGYLH